MAQDKTTDLVRALASISQANALLSSGDVRQAEEIYQKALSAIDDVSGDADNAWALASCLQSLADIHFSLEQYDKALEEYKRLHKVNESTLGPEHDDVRSVLYKIEKTVDRMSKNAESVLDAPPIEPSKVSGRFRQVKRDEAQAAPDGQEQAPPDGTDGNDDTSTSARKGKTTLREMSRKSSLGLATSDWIRTAVFVLLGLGIVYLAKAYVAHAREHQFVGRRCEFESGTLPMYKTADGTGTVTISHDGEFPAAEVCLGSQTGGVRSYYSVRDGKQVAELMATPMGQPEYWFEKTSTGLRSEDGVTFYTNYGSEASTVHQMHELSRAAFAWFVDHGQYPRNVADLGPAATYKNSCTGAREKVELSCIDSPNKSFGSTLRDYIWLGGDWEGEKPMHPGVIHCCSIVVDTGNDKEFDFFIRGAGADGKPLSGNVPGSSFDLQLRNGSGELPPSAPFAQDYKLASAQLIGVDGLQFPNSIFFLRHRFILLFLLIACVFLMIWSFSAARLSLLQHVVNSISWMLMVACLVIAGWLILQNLTG